MNTFEGRLAKIADIQLGYQARGRIEEDLEGDYTIIRPQDFNDQGLLVPGEVMRFSPMINPKRYLVRSGDILVQARGQNHFAFLLQDEIYDAVASNSFYIVRIHDQRKITPSYLVWWLNQAEVQTYFRIERGVHTIPFISKAVLGETRLRLPAMETQETINKLMQLWHREQKLNEQLSQKKEILIQEVCRKATLT